MHLYSEADGNLDLDDVHGRFVGWFLWGFIMALSPCASVLILWIASMIHLTLAQILGGIISCGIGCGGIAWWIAGIAWRFNDVGSFSSGDKLTVEEFQKLPEDDETLYQYSSGNFMLIYYLIVWSIIAITICCSVVAGVIMCFMK